MAAPGMRQVDAEAADRVDDAEAGRLLVVGEHDVDRRLEIGGQEIRHEREGKGAEALHVDGAAAVSAPVRDPQRERVRGPGLPRDRHDVGMAGQDDAAAIAADRSWRKSAALSPSAFGTRTKGTSQLLQIILDEVDQGQVRPGLSVSNDTSLASISSGVSR